ncbi:MAG: hypothetical protein E7417_06670, partial [Ruminococcaceae bacterium]|nr:hypothetical protein [Oscillospiraceae bacterium]
MPKRRLVFLVDICSYYSHSIVETTDDSGAEAISVGVVSPGKMMIQLGSSVYMILGTDRLIDDERL